MSYDQHTWGGTAFIVERANPRMRHYGYDDLGYAIPKSPISGNLVSSTKGNVKFAGYYTINLPDSVRLQEGKYFSVVLKFSGGYMPVEAKIADYSENAEVNERESYFSRDGKKWFDGFTLKSNACIKAYTLTR